VARAQALVTARDYSLRTNLNEIASGESGRFVVTAGVLQQVLNIQQEDLWQR
jgi:hypothetical protein